MGVNFSGQGVEAFAVSGSQRARISPACHPLMLLTQGGGQAGLHTFQQPGFPRRQHLGMLAQPQGINARHKMIQGFKRQRLKFPQNLGWA